MSKVENITRQKLYDLVFQELGLSKISCSAFLYNLRLPNFVCSN